MAERISALAMSVATRSHSEWSVWARDVEAEIEVLQAAIRRAHKQLSKHDYKGPKQVARAMLTLEGVCPDLAPSLDEERF